MEPLYLGESTDLLLNIPTSESGDTVTYEIFNSSGTVLDSGSMTFVRDEVWKVSFSPEAAGVITLKGNNTTKSEKREKIYNVRPSSAAPVTDSSSVPTPQEMLDNVTKAINNLIAGKAVQSYSIGGRSLQYMTLKELRDLKAELVQEVGSSTFNGRSYAKFVNPDD